MNKQYNELKEKIISVVPDILAERKKKKKAYDKRYKLENKDKISLQGKRYYKKYKDKINRKQRIYANNGGNLKRYNLSLKDYNLLLEKQNNVCAICGEVETTKLNEKLKKLSVDHCHKTKEIRGLLCDKCNRGLGYFRDNPKFLKSAITYLKKYDK